MGSMERETSGRISSLFHWLNILNEEDALLTVEASDYMLISRKTAASSRILSSII